jgi:MFS family permease
MLWRNRDFVKLWLGKTISSFGSQISGTALPLLALLSLNASPAAMGLLGAMGTLPVLLVGLPAGVWVDRMRRRPILIGADIGRALLLLSIPLAAAFDQLTLLQLYIVAALAGVLTVFFEVADQSFLPSVIGRDELVEGNSKLGVSDSMAEISGPAIGGGLVQLVGAPLAVLVDAVSYVVSAVLIGGIRTPEVAPERPESPQSMRQEIGEGLRLALGDPRLRALTLSSATASFFGNFIGALYGFYIVRDLELSPLMFGVLIGSGGIGALVGAIVSGRVARRFGVGRTVLVAFLLAGGLQLFLPLAGSLPKVVAAGVLLGTQVVGDVFWAIHRINEISLRQRLTPDRLLGRINASTQFLVMGMGPLGLLVGGVLGEVLGSQVTLAIAVAGMLSGAVWLIGGQKGLASAVGAQP